MGNKILWIILFTITCALGIFYLTQSKIQLAGDIPEYFGITESLLSHATVDLTPQDQQNLEQVLHPAYFVDPGYYIVGVDGNRYPVHFIFYSVLAIPIRIILFFFQANELKALALTNLAIFLSAMVIIYKYFQLSVLQKAILLLLLLLSPLAFFFAWPGPDLYYVMLLLVSLFLFYKKSYLWASIVVAIASWHSQPLLIMSLGFLAMYIYEITRKHKRHQMPVKSFLKGVIPLLLLMIPYGYNYFAFGVLTPWTLLQNGWTQVYGFGLQNASIQRFFEMMFDLNMGFFWYAPMIVVGGFFYWFRSSKRDSRGIVLCGLVVLTALFYQTNPAWHFGTAGYGPSRHIIFLLPVLIFFLIMYARVSITYLSVISLVVISQFFILSFNGGFLPNWENTLHHSPMARYILNHYPSLYNPTPEIFVDRTNHTDLSYLSTAIYRDPTTDVCRKAYVLLTDKERLEAACGEIPEKDRVQFDNPFLRKASYPRKLWTTEATFLPDALSCEDDYRPTEAQHYKCMKTLAEVVQLTGVEDTKRFVQLGKGIWKFSVGDPVEITVPAGYLLEHYSLDGFYINYD